MKNTFSVFNFFNTINFEGPSTWTCSFSGDGELGSENQGWLQDTSFSQETGENIQYVSRNDHVPTMLGEVQDAHNISAHHSFFFNLKGVML